MNNTARKILALLLSIITLFALVACGTKPAEEPEETAAYDEEPEEEPEEDDPTVKMSVKAYEAKAEELGMVVPIFNSVIQAGVSDSAVVLKMQDSETLWQAEYYILYNEESAKMMFDANTGDPDAETTKKADGTVLFEKTADGKYLYVAYYGRSLIYVKADEKYESEIKSFIAAIDF